MHDNITREFLVNNTNEFFDALIAGIHWPENVNHLPYKSLSSGSDYQYILEKGERAIISTPSNFWGSGGSEERNKRKSEEKSGSGRKKQKRSKDKFTLEIPEYLNKKNETESEDDSEVAEIEDEAKKAAVEKPHETEAEAKKAPVEKIQPHETEDEAKKAAVEKPHETEVEAKKAAVDETEAEAKKAPDEETHETEAEAKKAPDAPADEPENNLIQL